MKFKINECVKVDGTGYMVVGFDDTKGRYLLSKVNPCNGLPRKGAKPVGFSESRIKGWHE